MGRRRITGPPALGLGACGEGLRRFESHPPHHTITIIARSHPTRFLMQIIANDIHPLRAKIGARPDRLEPRPTSPNEKQRNHSILCQVQDAEGLSITRQVRYLFTLRKLSKLLSGQNFETATKTDLVNAVSRKRRHCV